MESSPILSRIWIYPIKSLDGVSVNSATMTPGGTLEMDREYALMDESGKVVNAKRTAKIHQVRSQFDLSQRRVTLSHPTSEGQSFHLDQDQVALEAWFSEFFGFKILLRQDGHTGFPDDPIASGPTLISEATLETTASWFDGMSIENMRSRLRSNLELSGVEAFWEDHLFSEPYITHGFKLGEVLIYGSNPCQRCIVPTRDQVSGASWPQFQKVLAEQRRASLPDWSDSTQFNHFYRLAVNTKVAASEQGKRLYKGDQWSESSR